MDEYIDDRPECDMEMCACQKAGRCNYQGDQKDCKYVTIKAEVGELKEANADMNSQLDFLLGDDDWGEETFESPIAFGRRCGRQSRSLQSGIPVDQVSGKQVSGDLTCSGESA